ncbi:hypothetical protein GSY69_00555 [Brevibacterium sp. 5221]|uniref:Uncharacterized protein n=1 Tax=Brevibacterium rongguiense TaxID=2695267 RepID=A0A6N9H3I7_9MICO|nr:MULTISPECIES: hypothetical protein [Brevibacterium]MYM18505.1 hypothetical protein [Brevibacterium rongguiense]WAL39577.1 hypothetical protein BRM1_09900 [Brevibacterium sp. BRM-1]
MSKATATVEEWEAKAERARAESAELDQTSGAAILDDPSAAERITVKVQAKEREARAYDAAAVEARQRLVDVYRKHLEDEAANLDKAAVQAQREADKHAGRVRALVDQLRDLDGVEYAPVEEWHEGPQGRWRDVPKSEDLGDKVEAAKNHAGLIRFYLEHGKRPGPLDEFYAVEPNEALSEVIAAGVQL